MLKTLYEHFVVLYENISRSNPTLAAEHALKQEQEVYERSSKLTYRNVCSCPYQVSGIFLTLARLGHDLLRCGSQEATQTRLSLAPIGGIGGRGARARGNAEEDAVAEAFSIAVGTLRLNHGRT